MGPLSVYRVGAVAAEPAYLFGGEACDFDLTHAAWLGWFPLTLVEWAGPDIAVAGDAWLTGPPGRSESGSIVPGDVVSVDDAAGELVACRTCGLTAFTDRPAPVPADGFFGPTSVAVAVADDLAAGIPGLRTAHEAWLTSLAAAGRKSQIADDRGYGLSGDSPAARDCARAVCEMAEQHLAAACAP